MNKSTASLIDELTVTNIKIYFLEKKMGGNKPATGDVKKIQELEKYRLQLHNGLNTTTPVKKTISALIDELTVTNIKIFILVDKMLENKHTKEDAYKAQTLNRYRSQLCNGINKAFKEREDIKV